MYDSDAERPDDYLGRTEFALRLRGLDRSGYLPVLTQGGAMRERDLITMDLDAPALVEPLMRNEGNNSPRRLLAALEGEAVAQEIMGDLIAEDDWPGRRPAGPDEDPDADDFTEGE